MSKRSAKPEADPESHGKPREMEVTPGSVVRESGNASSSYVPKNAALRSDAKGPSKSKDLDKNRARKAKPTPCSGGKEWTDEEFAADTLATRENIKALGNKAIAEHRAGKTLPFPQE